MNCNDSLNYFNNVLVVVKKLLIGLLIEPIGNEFNGWRVQDSSEANVINDTDLFLALGSEIFVGIAKLWSMF